MEGLAGLLIALSTLHILILHHLDPHNKLPHKQDTKIPPIDFELDPLQQFRHLLLYLFLLLLLQVEALLLAPFHVDDIEFIVGEFTLLKVVFAVVGAVRGNRLKLLLLLGSGLFLEVLLFCGQVYLVPDRR